MAKLVVEVLDASDLMPKDGQGSSSPFVEVDFDQQRQRTQTKPKDLNPQWNQPLVFSIADPSQLPNKTLDVVVYNDRKGVDGHHKNFLGRVRISGWSVPPSESQATVQRYPLDKRSLFSHIKGDIALKIYVVEGPQNQFGPQSEAQNSKKFENREAPSLFEENNAKKVDERDEYKAYEDEYKAYEDENQKQKSKKKEKEVMFERTKLEKEEGRGRESSISEPISKAAADPTADCAAVQARGADATSTTPFSKGGRGRETSISEPSSKSAADPTADLQPYRSVVQTPPRLLL